MKIYICTIKILKARGFEECLSQVTVTQLCHIALVSLGAATPHLSRFSKSSWYYNRTEKS